MSEAIFHNSVAGYLSVALAPSVFWTTVGHGGFPLHVRTAVRLKRAGVKAGVPDILLVHDGRAYWIELKAPKGKLSPAQIDLHYAILKAGAHVAVAKSLDDVRTLLDRWQIPTRARVAA